jgi:hypothetical protein
MLFAFAFVQNTGPQGRLLDFYINYSHEVGR